MPTYDYQCRSCGSVTEVIHSMLEDGPSTCGKCGGPLRRMLYPSGIIFKGSGFYRTDSRKAASSASAGSKDPEASSKSASSKASGSEGGTSTKGTGGEAPSGA